MQIDSYRNSSIKHPDAYSIFKALLLMLYSEGRFLVDLDLVMKPQVNVNFRVFGDF